MATPTISEEQEVTISDSPEAERGGIPITSTPEKPVLSSSLPEGDRRLSRTLSMEEEAARLTIEVRRDRRSTCLSGVDCHYQFILCD